MRKRGNVSRAVGRATSVRARETRGACVGESLKLAEGLASETPGCPWEELGESSRSLRGVVLGALRGTPAKIKERERKESPVKKKIKR